VNANVKKMVNIHSAFQLIFFFDYLNYQKFEVNGYNCASCGPNQWGFNQCNGCYDCECDTIGTVQASASCDLKTGQCTCKPGITGRTCDKCEPDHWNKTEAGNY
jgi:hypothetical protein